MGSLRQQQGRPEARGRAAKLPRPASAPVRAARSPRYGFAPVSPRHGLAPANGLPEPLKTSMEAMSGFSLDDVRVHRNSSRPATLGALAFTQAAEIHLGPGQDRHLPHEAWHVIQQMQGRVRPTRQMKLGIALNDHPALEREADLMGARAASFVVGAELPQKPPAPFAPVIQRKPFVANPEGELIDVATADADALAAVLNGFWASGKKGKITDAVSVAAMQRLEVMDAVSDAVAADIAGRITAKPKLLVEVIGSLWKSGADTVEQVLPPDLAKEAVAEASVQASLKALGGHKLLNAVQRAKLEGATAAALDEDALEDATTAIDAMTFDEVLTASFKEKHVAEKQTVGEASKEAHKFRETTRKARVKKTKAAPDADEKTKRKALRSADQAISTRFVFPDTEKAMIVEEVQALNRGILKRREANPRAMYRLTAHAYTFVSVYKQQGEETGKARFWYTVLGDPGEYKINHLDALADA